MKQVKAANDEAPKKKAATKKKPRPGKPIGQNRRAINGNDKPGGVAVGETVFGPSPPHPANDEAERFRRDGRCITSGGVRSLRRPERAAG